ncbi:MBL fold metallo-hydrolase [Henriciella aquimarina]|uniref:MBL fold metallo-hydrolase n=1 Tax=Henriciella aquimarina TaxID=545261 RepID=UPI000A0212F3|nr:MBL fold metallo-hydrolase [Henriciella aquimarina]
MTRWVWRILFVLLVLVLAGAVVFKAFQARIGAAVFERTADRLVGADQTARLEDGLHVYFCGTGSPLPDPTRAGPCLAVLAGETALVFDAGSGSMRKLARMGFPMGGIDHVFLTHLHSDHIDGLGELILQAWIGGSRTQPVPVSGPAGTGEVVAGFGQAYAIDATYRTAHHGEKIANPQGFGARAAELSLPPGGRVAEVFSEDGVTVSAFLVDHAPVAPAFGYRVDYKGRSVTVSGDTVRTQSVIEAAKGTDLLVHEALNRDMVAVMAEAAADNGDVALSKIFSDILDYHASPTEAADVAEAAGAKALVLTHIVPPLPVGLLKPAFLDGAGGHFDGALRVGEDGLVVHLPADSQAIGYAHLLD